MDLKLKFIKVNYSLRPFKNVVVVLGGSTKERAEMTVSPYIYYHY